MTILAAGNLREDPELMLRALVTAASIWMKRGLPIHELRIIEKDKSRVALLTPLFAEMKNLSAPAEDETTGGNYHVFLSFSSKDVNEADTIAKALRSRAPGLQLFDYRLAIDNGKVWQHEIDQALRACLRMISLLSPSYFSSPECREELSVARLLHKRRNYSFLFPLYIRSLSNDEELPFWLQAISYIDCREGDPGKLAAAANRLDLSGNADRHLSESPQ